MQAMLRAREVIAARLTTCVNRQEKDFPYQCHLKKHLKSPRCSSAWAFYGLKDGKITVNFSGWEQNRVVLEGAKPLR
jgi:hypothetical protein